MLNMATTSEARTGVSAIVDDTKIQKTLAALSDCTASMIREILAKARELKGLEPDEVAALSQTTDAGLLSEMFDTARQVKEQIYGKRLVLFAPLYISNLCSNECLYCAFRASNHGVKRRALGQWEIAAETKALVDQGHKRILLVAGERHPDEGLAYIRKAVETVYRVKSGKGEIRRLNVNIAPLTIDGFRELKATQIGTYQVFQETYHRPTYASVHVAGRKSDYDWRITAMDRAMQAGIDDVGIGVLFGLYDWHYEILALLQHIRHLETHFGVGPHTISVPRMEPAVGSIIAAQPPHPVSDMDFRKIIAILRMAVPYTGIIMSTRETPKMRRETFALGVSQISAGSRTNPGGYREGKRQEDGSQFQLGDHRPLDEVIRDVAQLGYIPSFCTACYRLGRTGQDFMDLAKPGEIKKHCDPNAISTFTEYLIDYSSEKTRQVGEECIAGNLLHMPPPIRRISTSMRHRVLKGERDVFC